MTFSLKTIVVLNKKIARIIDFRTNKSKKLASAEKTLVTILII